MCIFIFIISGFVHDAEQELLFYSANRLLFVRKTTVIDASSNEPHKHWF